MLAGCIDLVSLVVQSVEQYFTLPTRERELLYRSKRAPTERTTYQPGWGGTEGGKRRGIL